MSWSVDEVRTYTYTGSAQTDTADIGSYFVECWGAKGAGSNKPGGYGGYVGAYVAITASKTLNIYAGGVGSGKTGGFNGGGSVSSGGNGYGSAGGGASDVRVDGTDLTNRIIVAAGGGGGDYYNSGGHGGGLVGQSVDSGGTGGTQSAGGTTGGALGTGGSGVQNSSAGGGGYYGGGHAPAGQNRGGGGGSSYIGDAVGSTAQGANNAAGYIKVTYISEDPTLAQNLKMLNCDCIADTYSYSMDDTSTHGSSDMFSISGCSPWLGIPFLKFDLSALEGVSSEDITKAELRFCYYGHQGNDPTYTIKRALADWSESTLTWANQPSRSASYLSCAALTTPYGFKSHDILTLVKEWVDGTYENYGLALEYSSTGGSQNSYVYSKEKTGYAPYIYVEYTEGSAPTVSRRFAQII